VLCYVTHRLWSHVPVLTQLEFMKIKQSTTTTKCICNKVDCTRGLFLDRKRVACLVVLS